jgi:hypothetical protein
MKARSAAEVTAIRALLGALDNSTAVEVVQTRPFARGPTEVARRELTPGDIDAVIEREAAEREAAAARLEGLGLREQAAESRQEAAIIAGYKGRAA